MKLTSCMLSISEAAAYLRHPAEFLARCVCAGVLPATIGDDGELLFHVDHLDQFIKRRAEEYATAVRRRQRASQPQGLARADFRKVAMRRRTAGRRRRYSTSRATCRNRLHFSFEPDEQ